MPDIGYSKRGIVLFHLQGEVTIHIGDGSIGGTLFDNIRTDQQSLRIDYGSRNLFFVVEGVFLRLVSGEAGKTPCKEKRGHKSWSGGFSPTILVRFC